MTASPLLPASPGRDTGGTGGEREFTEAELDRMVELALCRHARIVAIGSGRSPAAVEATAAFVGRWEGTGGIVLDAVTWPEDAASWLRQAIRFAAADPDLWVMTGPPHGWAQMTRRLLWSTSWRPERSIAFAMIGVPLAIGLVGGDNLPGLAGATSTGGTWAVRDGQIQAEGLPSDPPACR
jgi:hypothetical protein